MLHSPMEDPETGYGNASPQKLFRALLAGDHGMHAEHHCRSSFPDFGLLYRRMRRLSTGKCGGWWMNGDGLIEPEAKEQVVGGEDS